MLRNKDSRLPSRPYASLSASSSPSASISISSHSSVSLLYHTLSLCAVCAFIDREGFTLKPAVVFTKQETQQENKETHTITAQDIARLTPTLTSYARPRTNTSSSSSCSSVFLGVCCDKHEHNDFILLCSNLDFFIQQLTFDASPSSSSRSALSSLVTRSLDVEDVARVLRSPARGAALPLILELTLYRDDAFLPDTVIDSQLHLFMQHYPITERFIIKVNGGLLSSSRELHVFNTKVKQRMSLLTACGRAGCAMLVDLSYERMVDLCAIDSSCLLNSMTFPCVRYVLTAGEANTCVTELKTLIAAMRTIVDIAVVVVLTVEDEAIHNADLQMVMKFICSQFTVLRTIILTRERAPLLIMQTLQQQPDSQPLPVHATKTDPYPLLTALSSATDGRLRPLDFVPFRIVHILSTLAASMGFGHFNVNISPMCVMATVIINTSLHRGVPLTHLFDLYRLYHGLCPYAARVAKGEKIGLFLSRSIQRCFRSCLIANIDCPDLFSFLHSSNPIKQQQMKLFFSSLQVILLHNKMDFGSIDIHRRCECGVVQPSPLSERQYAAQCTGCI